MQLYKPDELVPVGAGKIVPSAAQVIAHVAVQYKAIPVLSPGRSVPIVHPWRDFPTLICYSASRQISRSGCIVSTFFA